MTKSATKHYDKPPSNPARNSTAKSAHGHPAMNTAQNPFAALCNELIADRDPIEAIRTGFDPALLAAASDYFGVSVARIRAIMRMSDDSAYRLIKRHALLNSAASERLWRLADVTTMAEEIFVDTTAAKQWLRSPSRCFLGAAPIDYLDTEPGARVVRQVLNVIATGGAL